MDLDHELASALAIDPSPDFIARVRLRIAREPEPSSRSLMLTLIAVSCTALVTAMIVFLAHVDRAGNPTIAVTASQPRASIVRSQSTTQLPIVAVSHRGANGQVVRRHQEDPELPEVIVAPNVAATLVDLFVAVRDGRVDLTPLAGDAAYTPVEPARSEAVVAPMAVEVIGAIAGSEGARQ